MFDYYQEKKREEVIRKRRKKKFVLVSIVFFLFLGFLFFLFHSSFFQIKALEVEEKDNHQQIAEKNLISEVFREELNDLSWPLNWIFSKDNLIPLLFKKEVIIEKVSQSFPLFREVNLKVNFFEKKVIFLVKERNKFALWCKKDREECFWFDEEGIAFLEAPVVEGELIFKVIDYSENEVRKGEKVLTDKDYLKNLISVFDFLNKAGIPLRTLELKDLSLAEISTQKLSNFPQIRFSLRHSPFFALEAIERIKNIFPRLEYIDLTVENKIFYKEI